MPGKLVISPNSIAICGRRWSRECSYCGLLTYIDDDGELSLRLNQPCQNGADGAAKDFFMCLCQLPAEANWSIAIPNGDFVKRRPYSVRRFVKDNHTCRRPPMSSNHCLRSFDLVGGKPKKREALGCEPGRRQRCDRRVRSGNRLDANAGRYRSMDERRDRDRTRLASRHPTPARLFAALKPLDQRPRLGRFVVLVEAGCRRRDRVAREAGEPVRRVSSAAISATSRSTRNARAVMSSRLPIGVATTNSVPGIERAALLYHWRICGRQLVRAEPDVTLLNDP